MPLKKDKKNTENKKDEKLKTKRDSSKKISTKKITKKDNQEWTKIFNIKNWNHKTRIKAIILLLLSINLILTLVLINKINQINKWTLLYNWGTENYSNLKSVYESQEYKEYIENEINDLKKQLNDKEITEQ